jgi:hypothetical protein
VHNLQCSLHQNPALYCEGRGGGEKNNCAPSGIVRHTLDMRSQGAGSFVPVFAMKAHGSGGTAPPNPDTRSRAVTSSNLYRGERDIDIHFRQTGLAADAVSAFWSTPKSLAPLESTDDSFCYPSRSLVTIPTELQRLPGFANHNTAPYSSSVRTD